MEFVIGEDFMVALKIGDIKTFTSKLFVKDAFDRFFVREAQVVTYNSFTIDGRIRPGYYTKDELEAGEIGEFSSWKTIKPVCYSLIRGKKLPESFRVELTLGPEDTARVVRQAGSSWRLETVKGLYLGMRYENGTLLCVTGVSLGVFTMDRSLEYQWDETVKGFLKANGIAFSVT